MKAEREKINAKVKADTVRLTGGKLELTADEEMCTFLLVSEGSCTLQMGENDLLLNPGSAVLLGSGTGSLAPAGSSAAELAGCRFPADNPVPRWFLQNQCRKNSNECR